MVVKWTTELNKVIVTLGQIASAVGAYIVGQDQAPFNWDAFDVGLSLIWIGAIAGFISVALRANWIPGVTSGVGAEN